VTKASSDQLRYWIDGYFEETKMAHICIGDRAEAKLMAIAIRS
jgi:multidrug resistance efflux pump